MGWRAFGLFFGAIATVALFNVVVWRVHAGNLGTVPTFFVCGALAWWCAKMARSARMDHKRIAREPVTLAD
jgi:hypothetical protein